MKLALDGEVFCWNPKRGIPRVYREILSRIDRVDPEMEVSLHVQGRMASAEWDQSQLQIEAIPMLSSALKPWRFWQHVAPHVNRRKANNYWAGVEADVFHSTHYSLPPVKGPLFCVVHDMMPEMFPESFEPAARRAIAEPKRETVLRSDLVLCVSENTRQDLIRMLKVPEEKCRVVYNGGFDVDSISEAGAIESSRKHERPFLLYVGGWRMPYKNFDFIVDCLGSKACAGLGDYEIVVVSPEAPSRDELSRYEAVTSEGRLVFISNCDDGRLKDLYLSCAALIMPSHYEGFGLPVIEALGCGAPVASSNAASLPEVGGELARYFAPESASEFCTALHSAISSGRTPELVRARRERAREFSWTRSATQFCQAARDIVNGRSGS